MAASSRKGVPVRHMACSVTASFLANATFAFRGPVRSAIALAQSRNRLLADALFRAVMDHPVADLLGRPSQLNPRHDGLAELRMPDQLSLHGSALL